MIVENSLLEFAILLPDWKFDPTNKYLIWNYIQTDHIAPPEESFLFPSDPDPACLSPLPSKSSTFHILYSTIWISPILYYNDPLITPGSANIIVSIRDHPILNTLFFHVHACETANWLMDVDCMVIWYNSMRTAFPFLPSISR
jgi:hypothetical protein